MSVERYESVTQAREARNAETKARRRQRDLDKLRRRTGVASPCGDCGTTEGYVPNDQYAARRNSGLRFGFKTSLCDRCYSKHCKRLRVAQAQEKAAQRTRGPSLVKPGPPLDPPTPAPVPTLPEGRSKLDSLSPAEAVRALLRDPLVKSATRGARA